MNRSDDVYSCGSALLRLSGVASCVSKDQCILDTKGVVAGHVCIDREDWTAKDVRNFIDLTLQARTWSGNLEGATSVEVCGGVANTTLERGRICTCGTDAVYSAATGTCIPIPAALDEDQLLLDVDYFYGGRRMTQHLALIDAVECTRGYVREIGARVGGHQTSDGRCARRCVGIYAPTSDQPGTVCACSTVLSLDGKSCAWGCGNW